MNGSADASAFPPPGGIEVSLGEPVYSSSDTVRVYLRIAGETVGLELTFSPGKGNALDRPVSALLGRLGRLGTYISRWLGEKPRAPMHVKLPREALVTRASRKEVIVAEHALDDPGGEPLGVRIDEAMYALATDGLVELLETHPQQVPTAAVKALASLLRYSRECTIVDGFTPAHPELEEFARALEDLGAELRRRRSDTPS